MRNQPTLPLPYALQSDGTAKCTTPDRRKPSVPSETTASGRQLPPVVLYSHASFAGGRASAASGDHCGSTVVSSSKRIETAGCAPTGGARLSDRVAEQRHHRANQRRGRLIGPERALLEQPCKQLGERDPRIDRRVQRPYAARRGRDAAERLVDERAERGAIDRVLERH